MGFFSDLKEDLSQVVNELKPEELLKAPMSDMNQDMRSQGDALIKEAAVEMVKNVTAQIQSQDVLPEPVPDIEDVSETEEVSESTTVREPQSVEIKSVEMIEESPVVSEVLEGQSVVAADMTIAGDIVSEGSVELKGSINGNIDVAGKLIISGYVTGNSKANEVVAEGAKINGNIFCNDAVRIGASSVVIGDVIAKSATIAGAIKGDIDVRGPVVLEASAIVKGNIKSQSVRINDGAVIDGMCSQCYAEINPAAFFDDFKPEIKNTKI